MKVLDIPKSGKCGTLVAYRSRYGQCQRAYIIPRNRRTPARQQTRAAMGRFSRA